MPPTTQAADSSNDYLNLRDSYVPLFNGQPSEYREYRKRLLLYQKKMLLSKRGGEAVLNIIGSFRLPHRLRQGKGRDKGRGKGKGKNKNKSSTVIRYPPSTGGKADPRG